MLSVQQICPSAATVNPPRQKSPLSPSTKFILDHSQPLLLEVGEQYGTHAQISGATFHPLPCAATQRERAKLGGESDWGSSKFI